jgi:hypothetical protein
MHRYGVAIIKYKGKLGVCGSVVGKVICCKPEGHGFETQ